MLVVHIHVHVKRECVEAFKAATLANAQASVREPGIARFDVVPIARKFGRHALVVTGRDVSRSQRLRELLAAEKISTTFFAVPGEPTTDDVVRGVTHARAAGCDCVIGFGGGSAVDAAKAIA